MKEKNGQRPPWIIRTYAGFGNARDTNTRFKENLARGQAGLSIAFDLPTQNGLDPDAPLSRGEVGGCGVSIAHAGDMEALLDGIDLAKVNSSMTINATAPFVLALYLAVAGRRGIPPQFLRGTVQNDLMKEFVARGTYIFSPDLSLRLSSDVITYTAEHVPGWNPVNICGYHYTESGASPTEEIGFAFGNALLILDYIKERMHPDTFHRVVKRISFFINSGIELVPELCKIRAYSRLWPILCRSEYGVDGVSFRAGCQVRSLTLTAQQPENNIARITLEALPAILSAGARVNALQLPGFREAIGLPDAMEQSLSLRTQHILMHETGITDYPDIFAGSHVIEHMTSEMMSDALDIALDLRASGYDHALSKIASSLTQSMISWKSRVDNGSQTVVGVNAFHDPVGLHEQLAPAPSADFDDALETARCNEIRIWREKRNAEQLQRATRVLEETLRSSTNIMPATLDFACAGGTIGEWTSVIMQSGSGRHASYMNIQTDTRIATSRVLKGKTARIVLGKAGLDGHTNGLKALAIGCQNAGMEVILAGIKQTPEHLIRIAVEEDAGILGISCLSGAHLAIGRDLLEQRSKQGASHIKLVMGGIIPPTDAEKLRLMGFDRVVPTGSYSTDDMISIILGLFHEETIRPTTSM